MAIGFFRGGGRKMVGLINGREFVSENAALKENGYKVNKTTGDTKIFGANYAKRHLKIQLPVLKQGLKNISHVLPIN